MVYPFRLIHCSRYGLSICNLNVHVAERITRFYAL